MDKTITIRNLFPREFQGILGQLRSVYENLQEIRVRVNAPCIFMIDRKEYFPDRDGNLSCDVKKPSYSGRMRWKLFLIIFVIILLTHMKVS